MQRSAGIGTVRMVSMRRISFDRESDGHYARHHYASAHRMRECAVTANCWCWCLCAIHEWADVADTRGVGRWALAGKNRKRTLTASLKPMCESNRDNIAGATSATAAALKCMRFGVRLWTRCGRGEPPHAQHDVSFAPMSPTRPETNFINIHAGNTKWKCILTGMRELHKSTFM